MAENTNLEMLAGKKFSLNGLLDSLTQKEEKEKAPTKAERVQYWAEQATKEDLSELVVEMASYIGKMVNSDEPLTQDEIDALGEEYVSWRKINSFIESRNKAFRSMVFRTMDSKVSDDSPIPPHQVKDSLTANTSEGKVTFKREGGDRKKPSVDVSKLREVIGEDRFKKVVDVIKVKRQVIAAHTEEVFSEEKFVEAVYSGEISLDEAQEVLIPGPWQTPRFVVR